MRKIKIILTIAATLLALYAFPQQNKIDSLQRLLKTAKEDTNKVKILNGLSKYFKDSDTKKSLYYANSAYNLAKQLKYQRGIVNSYNLFGYLYAFQGDYIKSLSYFLKAKDILINLKDLYGISEVYNCLGNLYNKLGDYDKALSYYQECLKENKRINNTLGIGTAYGNIAKNYCDKEKYKEALPFYFKSAEVLKTLNKKDHLATVYYNISLIYNEFADYDNALYYYDKTLKLLEGLNDKVFMALIYMNVGSVNVTQGNYDKALKSVIKSIQLSKELGIKEYIKTNYKSLSELYSKLNNYQKAYEYYVLYSQYKDSISGEEVIKQFDELNVKYETKLKDKENKLLKKDNEAKSEKLKRKIIQNTWLIIGSCLLFVIAFVVYRSYRTKKRDNTIISAEKQRSDMLLLNILPAETAEELKSLGKASAKDYDMVTVMFTDFKGFTMLAEKLTPARLVSEIDYCFKEFDRIVMKYRIEKIKTIGDAYMCAGGLPSANETNPVDIVSAGLEIQHFMETYKKDRQSKGEVFFEIRIGIHTGPVVAGVVGIKKFAYDIWGDTVNIASRMESSGEVGKVNISGTTYEFVKDKFACTHRGKIEAKNKGVIDMYFVEKEI